MKKIIICISTVLLMFSSCKKNDYNEPNLKAKKANVDALKSEDPLVVSLINLSDYLELRNQETNGELIDYTQNNPDYTFEQLDSLGFVDINYLLSEMTIIESQIQDREEEEVIDIVNNNVNPIFVGFIDENTPSSSSRICIFCCTGCMNGVKRDHCITQLFWTYGPGC